MGKQNETTQDGCNHGFLLDGSQEESGFRKAWAKTKDRLGSPFPNNKGLGNWGFISQGRGIIRANRVRLFSLSLGTNPTQILPGGFQMPSFTPLIL
jgi:hypothetical protein